MTRTKSKKLSKTKQKQEDRKINNAIVNKYLETEQEQQRMIADSKDPIIDIKNIPKLDIEKLKQELKNAGLNTKSTVYDDLERSLNNNEAIRELVDIRNIRMKTNVTEDQHHAIIILASAYNSLLNNWGIDFKALKVELDQFVELSPSINGKRAEQYVDAHKAIAQALVNAQNQNTIRSEGKQ